MQRMQSSKSDNVICTGREDDPTGGREMIEYIYKCDLCDEKTIQTECCKVYFEPGTNKPKFVKKNSGEWDKTQNGRLVCFSCIRIIKAMTPV